MDFFFLDDIVPVIERIFADVQNQQWPEDIRLPKNINLTYQQKYGLIGIAQMIATQIKKPGHEIKIEKDGLSPEYTGSGSILFNSGIPLIGLYEGIRRTISALT